MPKSTLKFNKNLKNSSVFISNYRTNIPQVKVVCLLAVDGLDGGGLQLDKIGSIISFKSVLS